MKSVIYKIESKSKSKFYIGSAVYFNKRKACHLYELKNNKHFNKILQNHVNKYGIDDLKFSIVEEIENPILLIEREQYYINKLHPSFNICLVAGSRLGAKHSPEAIEKQRVAHKNMSLETRRKISEGAKNRVVSKETREKLSIAGKNRILTDEHKRKIGESNRKKRLLIKEIQQKSKDKKKKD